MRVIVQRVLQAGVTIEGQRISAIGAGLMVLVGFEESDKPEDIDWICSKIVQLRIFGDENGVMNISLKDTGGDLLLVSQFTLHASTKKGNRPSYIKSAKPETAIPLYENTIQKLESLLGKKIFTGEFGADMKVDLINEGPVTIAIDSKNRE